MSAMRASWTLTVHVPALSLLSGSNPLASTPQAQFFIDQLPGSCKYPFGAASSACCGASACCCGACAAGAPFGERFHGSGAACACHGCCAGGCMPLFWFDSHAALAASSSPSRVASIASVPAGAAYGWLARLPAVGGWNPAVDAVEGLLYVDAEVGPEPAFE